VPTVGTADSGSLVLTCLGGRIDPLTSHGAM
jgi:hypothetical protein